jgi:thiamine pyridinylase
MIPYQKSQNKVSFMLNIRFKHYFFNLKLLLAALLTAFFLFGASSVIAGKLVIHNTSEKNLICHIDGYADSIHIAPNTKIFIAQSNIKSTINWTINWVECNGLKQRNTHITSTSSTHWFIFNGKAANVFNVLLYPYIPSYPEGDFSALVKRMTEEFQALHPEVLVNIVISTDSYLDPYTFANLPNLLGPEGYDLVELDTMLLGEVVRQGFVAPVKLAPNKFWPAAYQAATYGHQAYGVPSRVCAYFLFSHDRTIENGFQSLNSLITYLHKLPSNRTPLIGDFNGSWNLPSFYLQSYASIYGKAYLNKILARAIDQTSINALSMLDEECSFEGNNKCINDYYHKQPPGTIEQDFANGKAHTYLGFSEASFYIKLNSSANVYATQIPYGDHFYPLVYTDVYVKNAVCKDQTCNANFKNFTDYMNKVSTQLWINFSEDLQPTMPPRYLLSAVKQFYDVPRVRADVLYSDFTRSILSAVDYPNNVTKEQHLSANRNMCASLKVIMPGYGC